MIYRNVKLNEEENGAWLELFVPDVLKACTRSALLVIPGGGYGMVCSDREGEPVAQAFLPYGFAAFVLHYSVGEKALFPRPLAEASLAMKYIRDHADEFGIDPERIFVTGFSAGGHLAAALGTMWHDPMSVEGTPVKVGENKPAGCIPVYPVITADPVYATTGGCIARILGHTPTACDKENFSLEAWVDEHTSPMFIVHTAEDQVVNVKHSLLLANACAEHNIPFEIHVYQRHPHGMSVANEIVAGLDPVFDDPHNATWVALAAQWAKAL